MRGRGKAIERKRVRYNLTLGQTAKEIKKWSKQGYSENNIGFNQSMPDENLTIQGEIMRGLGGLNLWYTTSKKPMNLALEEESLYIKGLKAKLLLETQMDSSSYFDLAALMELFPDSAIEFSTYRIPVGHIRGRNTVIWEVRNY